MSNVHAARAPSVAQTPLAPPATPFADARALLLTQALLAGWHALAPPAGEYILIIDAGSSGTRLYAYTWKPGAAPGAPPAVAAIPPSAAAHVVPRRAMPAKRAYQRVETEPGLDQFAGDAQALHTKAIGACQGSRRGRAGIGGSSRRLPPRIAGCMPGLL